MREREIEAKLVDGVKKLGGMCLKFTSANVSGVPDRMIILPTGAIWFVELKAPGKRERPLQEYLHGRLRSMGVRVYSTIDSYEKVLSILVACKREIEENGSTIRKSHV